MRWLLILILWNGRRIERLVNREPSESEWHRITNDIMSDIREAKCVEVGA